MTASCIKNARIKVDREEKQKLKEEKRKAVQKMRVENYKKTLPTCKKVASYIEKNYNVGKLESIDGATTTGGYVYCIILYSNWTVNGRYINHLIKATLDERSDNLRVEIF